MSSAENQPLKTTVSFVPEAQYDETDFYALALDEKAERLSVQFYLAIEPVREVIDWTVGHLGQKEALDYLYESPFTPDEITASLASVKTKDDRDQWDKTIGQYAEQPPRMARRFEQLLQLKDSEERLRQTYPEEASGLRMVHLPYRDVYANLMPAFNALDTVPSRLDHPTNTIAQIYGGEAVVDQDLLRAIRGKITANLTGIRFLHTPFGALSQKSSQLANYGLMFVGKELKSREELRAMRNLAGVDTMSMGLAEGLAIAKLGGLRIGDTVGFPQYIPNAQGDYYCGINVERMYSDNPYANPRLYFSLWRSEGAQNCLLAVTSKIP